MFKEYRIAQIGEVVGGGTPASGTDEYWNGDIPWITPKDLTGHTNVYISYGENNITKAGLNKSGTRLLPKNTVLFSSRAPIGYVAIASNPICTNQGFKSIICDEKLIDPLYLYYYIKANLDYFKLWGSGATFPEISGNAMKRIKIRIFDNIDVQKRIAASLYAYDKLIEVNNKRIKVLEQMAENLYKEWFVRFRFPGHETAEFENGIPKGWKIIRCKDIVPVLTGKKDANYGDEGGSYPFFTCAQESIQAPDYSFDCDAVLLAGNCDLNAKVYKGKFEAYQRTYVLSPHNITHLFLLYYVIKDNVERLKQASTGAAISFITKGMIERIHFLMPSNELLVKFHSIMDGFYTQKDVLVKQNKNLIVQRDLLLPRLMSGKLEVS